ALRPGGVRHHVPVLIDVGARDGDGAVDVRVAVVALAGSQGVGGEQVRGRARRVGVVGAAVDGVGRSDAQGGGAAGVPAVAVGIEHRGGQRVEHVGVGVVAVGAERV